MSLIELLKLLKNKGGIFMNYTIKETTISHTKGESYYAVVQNPTVAYHDRKVIYGSTPEVVERKIQRQIKKWEKGIYK